MKINSITLCNVKSFLERTTIEFHKNISILVGPNGGGKTNLLDSVISIIKKDLMPGHVLVDVNGQSDIKAFTLNTKLQTSLFLEKHVKGAKLPQYVQISLEITQEDISNIEILKNDYQQMLEHIEKNFSGVGLTNLQNLFKRKIQPGQVIHYTFAGGVSNPQGLEHDFQYYLQLFESIIVVRRHMQLPLLSYPLVYFPILRTSSGFQTEVTLSTFQFETEKILKDENSSKTYSNLFTLALGNLAKKMRLIELNGGHNPFNELAATPEMVALTTLLRKVGYEWKLACVDGDANKYQLILIKNGNSFSATRASSGEKEFLNYLFCIFGLNLKNALIVIDEPEMHLHPRWQKLLMKIFEELAKTTGNQFLMATHSPLFISPDTTKYISRVYSINEESNIVKFDESNLPGARHLYNIVSSQNNESIFFADKVILVEGMSDKIFFSKLIQKFMPEEKRNLVFEVIAVGGKGMFQHYIKVLDAWNVNWSIIADQDSLKEWGTDTVRSLFKADPQTIKVKVIDDPTSTDGQAIFECIENSINLGKWTDDANVWDYIKSKRTMLSINLSSQDYQTLKDYVLQLRENNRYVLSAGDLETYLPIGYKGKDMEKLITYLENPDFWNELDPDMKQELTDILMLIIHSAG